jgi:hypothetical protein
MLLIVLQIGKAKDLSAPLLNRDGYYDAFCCSVLSKYTMLHLLTFAAT